jgi:hypothetical protein
MILTASLFILAKENLANSTKTTPPHFGRAQVAQGLITSFWTMTYLTSRLQPQAEAAMTDGFAY